MFTNIFFIILVFFVFKSILIGSNYNFYTFYKYGKRYNNWYFEHENVKFNP